VTSLGIVLAGNGHARFFFILLLANYSASYSRYSSSTLNGKVLFRIEDRFQQLQWNDRTKIDDNWRAVVVSFH
jgi:hypothetical protein